MTRESLLDPLGFGPDEISAYDAFAAHGRLTLADLRAQSDAPPKAVNKAVETLAAKGLVRRLAGPDQEFVIAPPDHAIEVLIAERMNALQAVRARSVELAAEVRRLTQAVDPTALIEIVSGEGSLRQLFLQMVRSAREELAVFDRPPYALVAEPAEEVSSEQQHRMQADGLVLRTVFERSLLDDPAHVHRILGGVAAGEQARVASVPLKLAIIDREWAILPLLHAGDATPEAAVIVRRSVLLDSLSAFFDLVWEHAVEVRPTPDPLSDVASAEDDFRQLAHLMATGLTDAGIAVHLGVSERTVRRRIKDLMHELRVDSRFQAGVGAVQRGWL